MQTTLSITLNGAALKSNHTGANEHQWSTLDQGIKKHIEPWPRAACTNQFHLDRVKWHHFQWHHLALCYSYYIIILLHKPVSRIYAADEGVRRTLSPKHSALSEFRNFNCCRYMTPKYCKWSRRVLNQDISSTLRRSGRYLPDHFFESHILPPNNFKLRWSFFFVVDLRLISSHAAVYSSLWKVWLYWLLLICLLTEHKGRALATCIVTF